MQTVRIIRSKRKTVAIEIHPGGEVWIRAPHQLHKSEIDRLLEQKQGWIQRKIAEVTEQPLQVQKNFLTGESFLFQGKPYPLTLVDRTRPALILENGHFQLSRSALLHPEKTFEVWYRRQARVLFPARVSFLAVLSGLSPRQLRVSSARTRWGSCSANGSISLSWRLTMAPLEILDYVIIHELAHLKVKNHQKAFWDLVGRLMPDYAARRKWLKEHGHELKIR